MVPEDFKDHWFGYQDACISLVESIPKENDHSLLHSLLFLHGRFGEAQMWHPLVQELSKQWRCLAVDLPGFGRSFYTRNHTFSLVESAALVRQLVDQLTPAEGKWLLVGQDVGAGIAHLCAMNHPEKISGLVLINGACVTQEIRKVGSGYWGWKIIWKLHQLLRNSGEMSPELTESLLVPWYARFSKQSRLGALRTLEDSWPGHYERLVWKQRSKKLQQPTLVLWGKNDILNPPELGEELMRCLSEGDLFIHQDAGHWPHLECPIWVVQKIREFLFKIKFGPYPKEAALLA